MKIHKKYSIISGISLISMASAFLLLTPNQPTQILVPEQPSLVETKSISDTHSTGGTSTTTTDASTDQAPDKTSSPEQPSTTPDVTPSNPNTTNAPKQSEITDQVTSEIVYHALLLPNDPYAQNSTVITNTNAAAAWDLTTGSTVIVADIDSGFALAHEDLSAAWYTNSGEIGSTSFGDPCWTGVPADKSTNNCDDDQNGYNDDWRGWNFVAVDNNPQAGRDDPNGAAVSHGTETAGLIGAVSNNGVGTASMNWHTQIMPLQALDDSGSGYTSDIAAAIYYAVDNGAAIINMSLGGYTDDPYLRIAVQYAYDHNVVVVAAAGNCGTGKEFGCNPQYPGAIAYPAAYSHVIAVGAVDDSKQHASFSSYGTALDVVAPGSGTITSTMWTPSNQTSAYSANLYGTSFAAPIVSSYASLLRAERPTSTVDDITALIDASALKISGLAGRSYNTTYGHGMINARQGVIVAQALEQASEVPILNQSGSEISQHSFDSTSLLSSGCETANAVYCTVWAQDSNGYDRYLPYQLTSSKNDWQWYGSSLGSGDWRLRARSGNNYSIETYFMFSK